MVSPRGAGLRGRLVPRLRLLGVVSGRPVCPQAARAGLVERGLVACRAGKLCREQAEELAGSAAQGRAAGVGLCATSRCQPLRSVSLAAPVAPPGCGVPAAEAVTAVQALCSETVGS